MGELPVAFGIGAACGAYVMWLIHMALSIKADCQFLDIFRRQQNIIEHQAEQLERDSADWWKNN